MSDEQTGMIRKVQVASENLDDWSLPRELIISGNPVAKGKLLWQSDDKRIANGIWSCESGSFNWNYTWDETIYLIDGEITITDDHCNSNTYKAGDLFFITIGTKTTWNITQPVRKVFHFRSDDPVEL